MEVEHGETANDYSDYSIDNTPASLWNKSASYQKLKHNTVSRSTVAASSHLRSLKPSPQPPPVAQPQVISETAIA